MTDIPLTAEQFRDAAARSIPDASMALMNEARRYARIQGMSVETAFNEIVRDLATKIETMPVQDMLPKIGPSPQQDMTSITVPALRNDLHAAASFVKNMQFILS